MDATFLTRIVAATRQRIAERQADQSIDALQAIAASQILSLDFQAALRPLDGGVRTIAEIKRASPSKGTLRQHLSPRGFARTYARAGAAAISVLTEQDFFQGSLADLRAVKRSRAAAHLPILRKDFIIDPYQIVESRAAGADSFLLIVALLDDRTLVSLLAQGRALGMEPLVEVHDAAEAKRAIQAGAQIIGVNARDLHTFQVDTTLLERLRPDIPADTIVVAESGITSRNDVIRMRRYGAQAILVGESFIRAPSTINAMITLPAMVRHTSIHPHPIIKLCGMRTPADALAAAAAGADLIGIVLTPSKRQVSLAMARAIVAALPLTTLTVGVFAAEPPAAILEIAQAVGVQAVQFAARPDAMPMAHQLPLPAIIALSTHHARVRQPDQVSLDHEHLPLLDSAPPGVWGGTGVIADWSVAKDWANHAPIMLAGGLHPGNIADAIRIVQPWGVDVSTGIEDTDGQKDPARMVAFVEAVRSVGSGAMR